MTQHQPTTTPMRRSWIQVTSAILWPSFVLAGLATGLVFNFLDPLLIASELGLEDVSAGSMFSLGFFAFWGLTALSSKCTQYLLKPLHHARLKRISEE